MSHEVKYGDKERPIREAFKDNRFWLGSSYKDTMWKLYEPRKKGCDDVFFHMMASFIGIQGYPVDVMMKMMDRLIRMSK